jgi:Holliday junction DNA helicase RuvA
MIATLSGKLIHKSADGSIIEAAGVGYHLVMPTPDLASLPALGEEVRVYTFLQVKDDAMKLYGFENPAKKDIFIDLIGVNNIGPKAALAILSHLTPDELETAIVNEDIGLISTTPGIGRKTAQRLVLELRESIGKSATANNDATDSPLGQAREALMNLGYGADEASRSLREAEPGQTVDWYIKYALKRLATI